MMLLELAGELLLYLAIGMLVSFWYGGGGPLTAGPAIIIPCWPLVILLSVVAWGYNFAAEVER